MGSLLGKLSVSLSLAEEVQLMALSDDLRRAVDALVHPFTLMRRIMLVITVSGLHSPLAWALSLDPSTLDHDG